MKGRKKTRIPAVVSTIVEAIQDKKGKDIVLIDMSAFDSPVCDFFIICHGDSSTHVDAISEEVMHFLAKKKKLKPHSREGRENAQWILLDYYAVVVHIFQRQYRDFYNIEGLWADGVMKRFENIS
jgi:ribosome-associated protein